jgi:hypothetical protein
VEIEVEFRVRQQQGVREQLEFNFLPEREQWRLVLSQ